MTSSCPASNGRRYTSVRQRAQLLAAFRRSNLSAAAFTRRHKIAYSTFCAWQQRARAKPSVAFAEVELATPSSEPTALVIELGPCARVRLECQAQVVLAARLLQQLNREHSC